MWPRREGPVLCLVTDRRRLGVTSADTMRPLLELIAAAAAARVDLVQIREPDLPGRVLVGLVRAAVEACVRAPTQVLVNDRVDVALAAGASGVHLKSTSVASARVRSQLPAGWILGRSVHSVTEVCNETAGPGLDYVLLGTVFATESKPGRRPLGLARLREAVTAVDTPVLGIGGIGRDRVADVGRTGAAGFAAIGLFSDLHQATPQVFRSTVDKIRQRWRM